MDDSSADLMLQFHHAGGMPTVREVRALFGLESDEIDASYGVVATDPRAGLYVILVKPNAVPKIKAVLARRRRHPAEGLFANPRIEPTP